MCSVGQRCVNVRGQNKLTKIDVDRIKKLGVLTDFNILFNERILVSISVGT